MSVVVKRATAPVLRIEAGADTDGWGGNPVVFTPTTGPRDGYPALEVKVGLPGGAGPRLSHLRTSDARLLAKALFDWADHAESAR